MSRKLRHLAFSILAAAALATLAAGPLQATPAALAYSQSGVGATMQQACANATQAILDHCDIHGPISTDPGGCWPLWDLYGELVGYACKCKATATYCGIVAPFPIQPGFPH
jgi:hypothetical protein